MEDYELRVPLGCGAMGEVWLADQTRPLRRQVALKILTHVSDQASLSRFAYEQASLAKMQHPYIASAYDAGRTADGRPFLSMEYVVGSPITAFCDGTSLAVHDRLRLFAKVCDGVQYAHQKGVIHRDIKPSNVLVTVVEEVPTPKVIDFGIARAARPGHRFSAGPTRHGELIGTPEYMSPEQASGSPDDIDTRSDVYSLGALLYELLTGQVPIDLSALGAVGLEQLLQALRTTDPERPSRRLECLGSAAAPIAAQRGVTPRELTAMLRRDLDWIVLKAMAKNPGDRYASAGGLADDVRRYLGGDAVIARPPTLRYRAGKLARKHRLAVVLAGAFALFVSSLGLLMTMQAARVARERDRAYRVSQLMGQLFEAADPVRAQGRSITVREILESGASRVEQELGDEPEVQAQLMFTIGVAYTNLGLLQDAERLLKRSAEIRTRTLGGDHHDTLGTRHRLAVLYQWARRYAEAEKLHVAVLATQRRVLGEDHPETLRSMSSLASSYNSQGRFAEAENLYKEVLEKQIRVLGDDHVDTLASLHNLGNALGSQGEKSEALHLYRRAFDSQRRVLGEDHPHTLMAGNSVADALMYEGRHDEAEALHRDVLERRRRVLGENHSDTLSSVYGLAQVAALRGDRAAALEWLRRAADRGLSIADEMAADPTLASLHGAPAFEACLVHVRQNEARRLTSADRAPNP